jgi:hypothetical protein
MSRLKGQGTTAPLWRKVAPERRDSLFRNIEYFVLHGFFAWKIAEICGCTVSQVYQAAAKLQLRLSDYRAGKGEIAQRIIRLKPAMVKVIQRKAGG